MALIADGLPTKKIVHDFGVGVNDYAQFGREPPVYRPPACPNCGARNSLTGRGVRRRGVWSPDNAETVDVFLRRFECNRCDCSCSVEPSFLYPLRRYPLQLIQEVVQARHRACLGWRKLSKRFPTVAQSTLRAWVKSFGTNAQLWLERANHFLATQTRQFTVVRAVEQGAELGLLSTAATLLQHLAQRHGAAYPLPSRLFEGLWLWGFRYAKVPLLPPPPRCRTGPTVGRSP